MKTLIGEKISVLLEKIEDKNGEVIVSAQRHKKLKVGFNLKKLMKKMNQ